MTDDQKAVVLRAAEGGFFDDVILRWWEAPIASATEQEEEQKFYDACEALVDEDVKLFVDERTGAQWANRLWSLLIDRVRKPR